MSLVRSLVVFAALGGCACSNVLGADFDQDARYQLNVELPEHPHEAPHPNAPLPIASLTGSGEVFAEAAQLVCSSNCTTVVPPGSVVLRAEPGPGSSFAGWRTEPPTACDRTRASTCSLNVKGDVSVQAYFVKDGANLWGSLTGAGAEASSSLVGLAVGSNDDLAVGTYSGALENLAVPDVKSGAFVARVGVDGQLEPAFTVSSKTSVSLSTIARTSFGVVVGGYTVGASGDPDTTLEPTGVTVEADGAFVVAWDSNGQSDSPRWAWTAGGTDSVDVYRVAVLDDDTTIVVGLSGTTLVTPGGTLPGKQGTYLASLDSNGEENWVRTFDVLMRAGLALDSKSTFITSGRGSSDGVEPVELGGSCAPTPQGQVFMARFDVEHGDCIDAVPLPLGIQSVDAILTDVTGGIFVTGRFTGPIDFENQMTDVTEPDAIFIAHLNEDLTCHHPCWFASFEAKDAKLAAMGLAPDGGVLFGMNGRGEMSAAGTSVEFDSDQTFSLGRLDQGGSLAWWRTSGGPNSMGITDIAWDTDGWLMSGGVSTAPVGSFDFENVTQPGIVVQSSGDAFVARFAD